MSTLQSVSYRNPLTQQQASILLRQTVRDYVITAYVGGEDMDGPTWIRRCATEQEARIVGNTYHQQLKSIYGMQRRVP